MSRTISSTVLPIQRIMAAANPLAWRDGLVLEVADGDFAVAFLDGSISRLRVADAPLELHAGEPVAYHPVAEILDAARLVTTARAA